MSAVMQYALPAMRVIVWFLVVWFSLAGVVMLIRPGFYRRVVSSAALSKGIRPLGAVLLLVGAILFTRGEYTHLPWLIKTIGVVTFIKGGVALILPTALLVFGEWWADRSAAWLRVTAVAVLILAFGLFWSVRPGGPPPGPTEEEAGVLVPLEGAGAAVDLEPVQAPLLEGVAPGGANDSE